MEAISRRDCRKALLGLTHMLARSVRGTPSLSDNTIDDIQVDDYIERYIRLHGKRAAYVATSVRPGFKRLVDVGCGIAITSIMVAALHPSSQIEAFDKNQDMVDASRVLIEMSKLDNINVYKADAGLVRYLDTVCERMLLCHVLHTLPDPVALQVCRRMIGAVAARGQVIVSHPLGDSVSPERIVSRERSKIEHYCSPCPVTWTGKAFTESVIGKVRVTDERPVW